MIPHEREICICFLHREKKYKIECTSNMVWYACNNNNKGDKINRMKKTTQTD